MKQKFFLYLFLLVCCLPLAAQPNKNITISNNTQARRIAVVVGVKNYQYATPLITSINDARGMRDALMAIGFEVLYYEDCSRPGMNKTLKDLKAKLEANTYDAALYYFSGHGIQVGGDNYLVSVEADPVTESDVPNHCMNMASIMAVLKDLKVPTKIVLLDACRNNPFGKAWGKSSASNGFASMNAPIGSFIGFAVSPGDIALDGSQVGLSYSPYTYAILENLRTPGLSIFDVFTRVAKSTNALAVKYQKQQSPWMNSSLQDVFYFVPPTSELPPAGPVAPVDNPPGGQINKVETITDPTAGTFILVKGGTFQMGGPSDGPIHSVTVSDYYIGQTEVTQAQWRAVMGENPSSFSGCDACPVEWVSWEDIQTFITKLNNRSVGSKFRLPTQAEWEYAARGGKHSKGYTYSGSNDINAVAWHKYNSDSKTHSVKGKAANELGLYDMSGNVWEWCSDWYEKYSAASQTNPTGATSGSYCVFRGGSWYFDPERCVVAVRYGRTPDFRGDNLGFRLARAVTF